jgi:N-acetylmuramoyl-L-alanine amidase
MITPIFKQVKEMAYKMYLESLKEAKTNEDEDLVIVADLEELAPICEDEKQLIDYISNFNIKRKIEYIAIHCTATQPTATVTAIQNYWRNNLGWKNPGYHILFHAEKGFTVLMDLNGVSNGVQGFNSVSINLSYIGGIDKAGKPLDTRTPSQKRLMRIAVDELRKKLGSDVVVKGHRDFPKVAKACPCFCVATWLKEK